MDLPQGISVWNQYTICIPNQSSSSDTTRDILRYKLKEKGIIAMVYYPLALHLQLVYKYLNYQLGSLPEVERVSQEVLSLPMFPGISFEEQQQVVYCLKDCLIGH